MSNRISNMFISPPKIFRRLFYNFVWEQSNSRKKIFLTFDDGPSSKITTWILEILKQYNAKATFFCVGNNVLNLPLITQQIINDGHSLGNHTFHHLNGFKTNYSHYINDFVKADKIINTQLFRPPYGKIKKSQAQEILKFKKIIMWDVLSLDYDNSITPQQCFKNIKKNTKSGSIIVLHDNLKAERNMKYALQKTLDYYTKAGYSFAKIQSHQILGEN